MRVPAGLRLALALAVVGCATIQTTDPGVVGVDRPQRMLYSAAVVHARAAQQYSGIIEAARNQGALDQDAQLASRVRRVADRLLAQASSFRADADHWAWESHVISSREVNAFCAPGGKIVVYTAMLTRLDLSDDELAALLGHEIAHALREHGRERMSEQAATFALLQVGSTLAKLDDDQTLLAELLTRVMFTLPNSRLHEQEADRVGIELAARAGFDPSGGARLFDKMKRLGEGGGPSFLSTHPSHESRTADLQRYAALVRPLFDASGRMAVAPSAPAVAREVVAANTIGFLTVGSQTDAKISVNGNPVSANPLIRYAVPAGPVRLAFKTGAGPDVWSDEMTVIVAPGEHRNLGRVVLAALKRPTPVQVGYLTVGSNPIAAIFVDDVPAPQNPLVNEPLRPGTRRLRFVVTEGASTWTQDLTVTLAPGERKNLGRITLVKP